MTIKEMQEFEKGIDKEIEKIRDKNTTKTFYRSYILSIIKLGLVQVGYPFYKELMDITVKTANEK